MRGWVLYLRARSTVAWCALWSTTALLAWWAGPAVYEVQLSAGRVPRYLPAWELMPVVAGVLGPALLVPRLYSWERLGRRNRIRWRAGGCAVLAMVGPALIPWIAHFWLPAGARWWDILWNVVLFAAGALVLTALLGRLVGPVVGLVAYAALLMVQHSAPDLARRLPVSGVEGNLGGWC